VEKIEQLWEDFELSAYHDGLAYAEQSFRQNKIHEDIVKDLSDRYKKKYFAQEPVSDDKHSTPKNETFTPTPAQESWADQVIAEAFPAPKKKRKVKHDPRVVQKNIAKELIVDFLHQDKNKRLGFKISDLYEQITWVNHIDERTLRRYLDELYKGCRVNPTATLIQTCLLTQRFTDA
jgi:hypothetical protein